MSNNFKNILVATSDAMLSKDLISNFQVFGFSSVSAGDAIEALYIAEKSRPDAIVLDSDILKISADELVLLFKKIPGLDYSYIFFLHPKDHNFGLNGSVDQYIEKPISGKSLVARIRSVDRSSRTRSVAAVNLKKVIGDLTVDRDTYMVYFKGNEILLPRKEFELIYLLASRPEKVFTREEIFKHIWHKEITPKEGRTIDVHIRKLRSKISEDLITTIKGIGYKIVI